MSENDVFVRNNFHRLPWWVSGQMIEETIGRFQEGGEHDESFWIVPETISLRVLTRGRKGHAGKTSGAPIDLFESSTIRKAIETWG